VDLSQPRSTGSGRYWYNLHVVLVHRERWAEVREETLQRIHDMIIKASAAKEYWLSRAGILPDHIHLVLGCPIGVTPAEVALGFLNNLAHAHGMRPVYQFGGYLATVGEYTHHALRSETSLRRGEPGGDE
jgi:REP element-mobilizing transposase RayT